MHLQKQALDTDGHIVMRLTGVPIDIRIDHILTGKGAIPLRCYVGPDIGSDHRPVIADINIPIKNQ